VTGVQTCALPISGIEAENGLFNPMGTVTGYDALFAIRKIKERLNIL
jgi:hypothetical protein